MVYIAMVGIVCGLPATCLHEVAWSTFACCGGGLPSSVGACVVKQWKKIPPCVRMLGAP